MRRALALLPVTLLFLIASQAAAAPPVVDGGADQVMLPGELLFLQGTAFDPDGGTSFIWEWKIIQGPADHDGFLTHATTSPPFFTATVLGQYTVAVGVVDSQAEEASIAFVLIDVVENFPPDAVAVTGVDPLP